MNIGKRRSVRINLPVICIVLMMTLSFAACADNPGSYVDNPKLVKMGGRQPYRIDESIVEDIDFSLSDAHDIRRFLDTENDDFSESMKSRFSENAGSFLFGAKGCYISAVPIRRFNVEYPGETKAVMYFVFTEDMFPAGSIYLSGNNGKINSSGSYIPASADSQYIPAEFLRAEPDSFYVPLTDNSGSFVLLDKHNETVFGADRKYFIAMGKLFKNLKNAGFGVSYNEIVSAENLIWYEF